MRIGIYGGSFNPPGRHHRAVAQAAAQTLDTTIVVPCGLRDDRPESAIVDPKLRSQMCALTFDGMPGVELDLFDVASTVYTRSFDLYQRYRARGEPWLIIGADLVAGGASGTSPIQRSWYRGQELWSECNFLVIPRPGFVISQQDLPPHSQILKFEVDGSSSQIRAQIAKDQAWQDLVMPDVFKVIEQHHLYKTNV